MNTLAAALPAPRLIAADLLKLRRRRGLVTVIALMTTAAIAITYATIQILHHINPGTHGPAGGIDNLGHGTALEATLGVVAAMLVGSSAAVGDLDAGVYRDLVVTGRSRLALYLSRIPAGFAFLLPFVSAGYALAATASVVLADGRAAPGIALLVKSGLWVLLQVAFYYLLAVAVACLIGSRSYTLGVLLAFTLAVSPLLTAISALGVVRELVPQIVFRDLLPTGIAETVRQGPQMGVSLAAMVAVLVVWTVAAQVAGAWRDTHRDA